MCALGLTQQIAHQTVADLRPLRVVRLEPMVGTLDPREARCVELGGQRDRRGRARRRLSAGTAGKRERERDEQRTAAFSPKAQAAACRRQNPAHPSTLAFPQRRSILAR
jgi:hypothetical protein